MFERLIHLFTGCPDQSPNELHIEEKPETYDVDLECENCDESYTVEVPKGVTIKAFLAKEDICPNCGC